MNKQGPIKPALCPHCSELINAVVSLDLADPSAPVAEPGDLTFCAHCAARLVFDDTVSPAAVTDAQRAELLDEMPELKQAEKRARSLAASARPSGAHPSPPPDTDG